MTVETENTAEILIAVEGRKVHDVLTTKEGWEAWFSRHAEIQPQADGRVFFEWNIFDGEQAGTTERGSIIEASANSVAFRWTARGFPTTVRFLIRNDDRGTLLR